MSASIYKLIDNNTFFKKIIIEPFHIIISDNCAKRKTIIDIYKSQGTEQNETEIYLKHNLHVFLSHKPETNIKEIYNKINRKHLYKAPCNTIGLYFIRLEDGNLNFLFSTGDFVYITKEQIIVHNVLQDNKKALFHMIKLNSDKTIEKIEKF